MRPGRLIFAIGIILLLISASASAFCLDGRHPSVAEETRDSVAVVIGTLKSVRNLSEDTSDPGGVTATVYTVNVLRQLKGKVASVILIRSDNTSSRFVMEKNRRYRLFLGAAGSEFVVDSCGNSGVTR